MDLCAAWRQSLPEGRSALPVGENTLGRMFNVLGNPIDELDPPTDVENWSIHRSAPAFEEQATSQEMLETGIKRLVHLPCSQGGKIVVLVWSSERPC